MSTIRFATITQIVAKTTIPIVIGRSAFV